MQRYLLQEMNHETIYMQKWKIHSQMSTFSTQFISDNGFKFISNYVYRMKYFSIRLLSILLILAIPMLQMIIPMHKIISTTSDKSVVNIILEHNEFKTTIFLFSFGSKTSCKIVFLITTTDKYYDLEYFYARCSIIITMNYSIIECIIDICIDCPDITYLLIVDDVTFNKNFNYFLWCIKCLEYTIFIKDNLVLIIISITIGTICGVYNFYSLLTVDKKENTKNKHSARPQTLSLIKKWDHKAVPANNNSKK